MLDFDFSVEHVLMFMIAIFLLYHLVGSCGCMKDGFSVGGQSDTNYKMLSEKCDNTSECSQGLECVNRHCTNMCRKQVDGDVCENIIMGKGDGSYQKARILCNNSWYKYYNPDTKQIENKTCYWNENPDSRQFGCQAYNDLLDDTFVKCINTSNDNYMECGSCPLSEAKCDSNCKAYEVNNCAFKGKKYECMCPSNVTKCHDT
jgi:hypothetical protein